MARRQAAKGFLEDVACELSLKGGEYKPREGVEEREKMNNGSGKNIPGSKDEERLPLLVSLTRRLS